MILLPVMGTHGCTITHDGTTNAKDHGTRTSHFGDEDAMLVPGARKISDKGIAPTLALPSRLCSFSCPQAMRYPDHACMNFCCRCTVQ